MVDTVFASGDSVITSLIADLKTAILGSAQWANPAGDRLVGTTVRGASMVVDLADTAVGIANLNIACYRTTGLSDKITRMIPWRTATTSGATSNTVHWTISAGHDHLFISIEGPRSGETGYNAGNCGKGSFFIGDIVPYHAADTQPAVVVVASQALTGYLGCEAAISRNQANNASWVTGRLLTMTPPVNTSGVILFGAPQVASSDGNIYMWPYVVCEDVAGMRGRVGKAFFQGFPNAAIIPSFYPPLPPVYRKYTVGSETFISIQTNSFIINAFGYDANQVLSGPVLAVPYS